jgi:hypothetical protein
MRLLRYVLVMAISLGVANAACAQEKQRRLLVIGQSKGYQHDSISTAMATLYNLGRCSHHCGTFFRTGCTAITKKPLKWEAKNLDAFDAVAFFTDGELVRASARLFRASTLTLPLRGVSRACGGSD